ncbi:LAMI_0E00628g1_1 [Lachancea mirantina]|uniref:DNA replication ATP-dependent helicase/nuclease DNA2 n=1 Tax=Lachancea mirantina TaxID=1230905 RepID=A0A1G4JIK9_9SACH|nr:LAMI_0E00628g1_1 [Lachancea mirantina]
MDSEIARKRRASLNASPAKPEFVEYDQSEDKGSAANDSGVDKPLKPKKKYRFTPFGKEMVQDNNQDTILRSIPVSFVKNTRRVQIAQADIDPPQAEGESENYENLGDQVDLGEPFVRSEVQNPENAPSEEVIWQYFPSKVSREITSRQERGVLSSSQESLLEVAHQSSTPIVHDKFKTVLNFSHINIDEGRDEEGRLFESRKASLRQSSTTRSSTIQPAILASTRDIEDIIHDIEGGFERKSKSCCADLPSSPMKSHPPNRNGYEIGLPTSDSIEDDDSLIHILTQRYTDEKEQAKSSNSYSLQDDESSEHSDDDSLLDLLENQKDQETQKDDRLGVEEGLDVVQEIFSQKLSISEEKLEAYKELVDFSVDREDFVRLVIVSVNVPAVHNATGEKHLTCINKHGERTSLTIRPPWTVLEYEEGDVLHIIKGQNVNDFSVLSNEVNPKSKRINDNLLVQNPDILLSATTVGKSVECSRRSLLSSLFSGPMEPSLPALIGNIVHEILQSGLRHRLQNDCVTQHLLKSQCQKVCDEYETEIVMCGSSKDAVVDIVCEEHIPNIVKFINDYVTEQGESLINVSGTRSKEPFSINNIIDIEENIWSPVFGIKGFLDATIEARSAEGKFYVAPLEIKSGRTKSLAHEVQGSLYTLLLRDRYEIPVSFFLLYYTRTNEFVKHNTILMSLKHLLILRNQLSRHLKHGIDEIRDPLWKARMLPSILRSSACDNCFTKEACMVINKLSESGTAHDSGLKPGEYESITSHLNTGLDKDFYEHYENLITKEESSLNGINNEMFLLKSTTRESLSGKCLSELCISDYRSGDENIYFYTFVRKNSDLVKPPMTYSQLSLYDMVIISDEQGHFALCTGRVSAIMKESITIKTTRRLDLHDVHGSDFESKDKQRYESVLRPRSSLRQASGSNNISYRIDRNEIQQGLALARYNVLNLFLPPVSKGPAAGAEQNDDLLPLKPSLGGDSKRRELIVENRKPVFKPFDAKSLISSLKGKFNQDQIQAIKLALEAQDYALILGMPGTGKTTVIAEIIRQLVSMGKTVLLTSYTHSAVDNILLKLLNDNISTIRLGHKHKIHSDAQRFMLDFTESQSYEDLIKSVQGASVVATTCLGIHDSLLNFREADFDYVILDEASQLSLPIALGPLRFGEKFIMVGDHYQLPPLVRNEAARIGGLEVSLFKNLCERHRECIAELTYQYRMCEDIMALSNHIIYDQKLKCGTEQVKNGRLEIPNIDKLVDYKYIVNSKNWLYDVLDSEKKVIFLDYDDCEEITEICDKDNIRNPGEAKLVGICVRAMVNCGVDRRSIGIMTTYRAQLRVLKKIFSQKDDENLEVLTADQFQGRDKDCVIISMVRRNPQLNSGSLLKDLRRVNVAMTRAKTKLIIIGSRSTIGSTEVLKDFFSMLKARNWIYELPKDCLRTYRLDYKDSSQGDAVRKHMSVPLRVKNITSDSKLVEDKPMVRDILNGM